MGREPFDFEPLGRELRVEGLKVERLKTDGLLGCPFDPTQRKGSALYACPVAMEFYNL